MRNVFARADRDDRRISRCVRLVLGFVAVAAALAVAPMPAHAAPATPIFGPAIDDYAPYDPQDSCPANLQEQPGTVALRDLLNQAYGNHDYGIARSCNVGDRSEHKEGRALDYMLNVENDNERGIANDILKWMLTTDQYGNKHAMARRLGIMYMIWNRQIWSANRASEGWRPYSCDGSANDCHTNHIHFTQSWAGARKQTTWWTGARDTAVSVYGVLSDGRLTYAVIEPATGNRTKKTVTSTAKLGFPAKALATLNFNTVLVTSTGGKLYRVDIITNNNSLAFADPVEVGQRGWVHDLLAYDGHGRLYGIADGTLHRYEVGTAKPTTQHLTGHVVIGKGFTLKTLTATGQNWILGVSNTGELRSYQVRGVDDWSGATLKDRWSAFTHVLSPGHGLYYGRTAAGAMYHYLDQKPYDLDGDDIEYYTDDPVDERGWTQELLSAQPIR